MLMDIFIRLHLDNCINPQKFATVLVAYCPPFCIYGEQPIGIWRRLFETQAQGGGSLLCFASGFAENDPRRPRSGLNKSREVYFYGKKDFMKKYFLEIFFFSILESGGRWKSNIQRAQMVNRTKNGRFWGCFSTIPLSKTLFLAWMRSSHGVLSMIFGFLTKFWL